jgi:hypothetical protein
VPRSSRLSLIAEEKIPDISDHILQNLKKSVHKLAQQTGVSYGSTRTVLKKHLHLHLYKITSVHELKEKASIKCVEYCEWFSDINTANGEDILGIIFFTDDVWFHLSNYVNNQNSHICSTTNPHEIKVTPLHDQKVGMWCTISQNWIIGSIFFDDIISLQCYYEAILYPFI